MNKQQAEQILMKLIADIPMKRQDYVLLEQAIHVLKTPEVVASPTTGAVKLPVMEMKKGN